MQRICSVEVSSACAREKSVVVVVLIASRERAAELHFRESEAITKAIGGADEPLQLFAAAGIKKLHLAGTAGERGKFDADKAQFRGAVPCA
jgi:hypothetical protein